MAAKKKHLRRVIEKLHNKKGHGCIWRHEAGYGSYRNKECHYRKEGFAASDGRKDMYNKDHRSIAVRLKYAKWSSDKKTIVPLNDNDSRFGEELKEAKKSRKAKSPVAKFVQKFRNKFNNSMKWLEYHEEGWHLGHREHKYKVRGAPSVEPTFKPKDKDTYAHGAWYPYHHEYHHLIAVEALREQVITDMNVRPRIEAMLATGWNINKGLNVMFLPTEIAVATIVKLPAHCPWDKVEHTDYSESLAKHLQSVRTKLDDAVRGEGQDTCEDKTSKMSLELDKLAKRLLKAIKKQPGRELGSVPEDMP